MTEPKKTIEERIEAHLDGIHRLCDKSGQNIKLLRPHVMEHYRIAQNLINLLSKRNSEQSDRYLGDLKELPNLFTEYKNLFTDYIKL